MVIAFIFICLFQFGVASCNIGTDAGQLQCADETVLSLFQKHVRLAHRILIAGSDDRLAAGRIAKITMTGDYNAPPRLTKADQKVLNNDEVNEGRWLAQLMTPFDGPIDVSVLQISRPSQQALESVSTVHEGSSHSDLKTKDSALGKIQYPWAVGIFMTIVGQTLCVLGMQIQKISHMIQASQMKPLGSSPMHAVSSRFMLGAGESPPDEGAPYYLQWRWIVGAIIWAFGHITCWVALGLAPQSILSCLQSWNIVAALALAPVLLNERLPPNAFWYASLLVIGCVVVVVFGPRTDDYQMETVASLQQAFTTPSSIAVHILCLGLLILSMTSSYLAGQIRYYRVERYILMSATCGWYAALFSKSISMVVITSVSAENMQMKNIGFWFFGGAFVAFALGQIHFMNLGLRDGLASLVLPMYEGTSMIGQLLFGGIIFGEFHTFQGNSVYGFVPGVVVVLVGLLLLIQSTREMTENGACDSQQ
jgi:uncharacterized membrane protein